MNVLQRFERRVENLVNGAFAKAFRSGVEPVEVAGALARACDERAAIVSRGRTMVPNSFTVTLATSDHARLAAFGPALCVELSGMVRDHAAEQGYTFVGPVEVELTEDRSLDTGVFHVNGSAVAGRVDAPQPEPVAPPARADRAPVPAADATSAVLTPRTARVGTLTANGVRLDLVAGTAVLGRGPEASLRLDDPGVSRRHAEVRVEGGRVTVVDLGSTNGVLVDGRRVEHAVLSPGAVLRLGSTDVLYEAP